MKMLDGLTPRERVLLSVGAGVVVAAAMWMYVWQPLADQRREQQDRIARYAAILDLAERAPETSTQVTPACAGAGALAPRVVESAEKVGIPLARLDPQGAQLRVTVAETAYDTAVAWIAALEAQTCVRATAIEMSRLTAPGQVSMRITLQEAGL